MLISESRLNDLVEKALSLTKRCDLFLPLVSSLRDDRVFDHELLEIALLVDFAYELSLCYLLALVHQEGHNRFRDEVGDVLFDNAEVRLDQVLNDDSFHDNA